MLDELKNLDIKRMTLDEAISLSAFGKMLRGEYEVSQAEVPEWLSTRLRELSREIHARLQDSIELRLRKLKAAQETDLEPSERRAKRNEEIAALEQKLAV